MYAIHVDSTLDDDARRERLYDGDLFVYSPRPATRALVEFAAELAEEAFGSLEPETAQYEMSVESYEHSLPISSRALFIIRNQSDS